MVAVADETVKNAGNVRPRRVAILERAEKEKESKKKKAIRKDANGQEKFEDYFSDSEEDKSKNDQSANSTAPVGKDAEESMEVDEVSRVEREQSPSGDQLIVFDLQGPGVTGGEKPAEEPKEPEKEKAAGKAPQAEYEEWKKKSKNAGEPEKPKEKEVGLFASYDLGFKNALMAPLRKP